MKHPARKCIDPNICSVADLHIRQLSLFEICLNPFFASNQIDHLRPGSDQLAGQRVPFSDRSIGRCRDSRVGQIYLGDDNGSLLRRYISFVNVILCVQRLPLALRCLELALACGQGSSGAREIRLPRVYRAAELTLLRGGRFQLLVSCRLRVEQGLLTMKLSQSLIELG